MWTIDFTGIIVWYWLLALLILLFSFISFALPREKDERSVIPLLWGITIGVILVLFHYYLEPALFGWLISTDWLIMVLSFIFMCLWVAIIIQGLYNSIRYNRVVA